MRVQIAFAPINASHCPNLCVFWSEMILDVFKPDSEVGFAELKETADDRANIGRTIIGAPIVGQQLAQSILTDHQDADSRPMNRLIFSR